MNRTPSLSLYIGAHRTGSTALQKVLFREPEALHAEGVTYWGPQITRFGVLKSFISNRVAGKRNGAMTSAVQVLADEVALEAAAGCKTLLVSDENFLGTMRGNLAAAALYPEIGPRLAALKEMLPLPPARIFMCLRDFAGYWRSLVAYQIGIGNVTAVDAAQLAAAPGNSWMPVILALRQTFPEARLSLWRYENDPAMNRRALAAMLGKGLAQRLPVPVTGLNASLSAAALTELARLPAGPERDRFLKRARQDTSAAYELFTPEQKAALAARFDAEWQAILDLKDPAIEILRANTAEVAP